MRNIAHFLKQELSRQNEILAIDINELLRINILKKIHKFNPQIIHVIPGPTLKLLILLKILKFYFSDSKIVISAIHPSTNYLFKKLARILEPDLTLIQSYETEALFHGCRMAFLPNGVDTKRFMPVSNESKLLLRDKYGINRDAFVVLHVGSVKNGRGIGFLKTIKEEGHEVILVGNKSMGIENDIYNNIMRSGCKSWLDHLDKIEDIYNISDCYFFPTPPINTSNSIELPLSVLEAMSCNLPIVTTKFGALTRVFEEGNGLIYIDKLEDSLPAIKKIKSGAVTIKTRSKVLPYEWKMINKRLIDCYENLLI